MAENTADGDLSLTEMIQLKEAMGKQKKKVNEDEMKKELKLQLLQEMKEKEKAKKKTDRKKDIMSILRKFSGLMMFII